MKRFRSIALVVVAVLMGVVYALPAATADAQSSASLSIVPKKNYPIIEPGKSIDDTLVIRNLDAAQSLELSLRVVDFTFTNDGGTPKLFLDADAPQTTWSLKPFLSIPETVSIPPSSSKTIKMNVKIPANQGAGSYYSAIIYSSGAGSGSGNVGLSASGVTLVFAGVPGQVKEDLTLKKFGAYDQAANGSTSGYMFVTDKEPQTLAYTLQNEGNVTEAPVGSIVLKDMFGHERTIENVNPSSSLALIGQTRTYTACIKLASQDVDFNGTKTQTNSCTSAGLWPGYYTAKLDLFYGQNGNTTKEIQGVASFWYLPLWFVIIVVLVLLALTYFVWRIVSKIRSAFYGPKIKRSSSRRR